MKRKLSIILALAVALVLLQSATVAGAPDQLGGGVHVVQWGENLATIAFRYGVSTEALAAANGISDPNLIYIGQQLVIPGAGGGGGGPADGPRVAALGNERGGSYQVQYGDTLTSIAGRFGCSVDALMNANGLTDTFIFIGQPLSVPAGGPGGPLTMAAGNAPAPVGPMSAPRMGTQSPTHVVQRGETLSALAYRYGTSINDLMQANNLPNPWMVMQGQTLVIPGMVAQGFEQPAGTAHTVQIGETLAGIALRYGTTVPAILQANNMSMAQSQIIIPGQEVVIPGTIKSGPGALQGPVNQPMAGAAPSAGLPPQMGAASTAPNDGFAILPADPPGASAMTLSGMPQSAAVGAQPGAMAAPSVQSGAAVQAPLVGVGSAPIIAAPASSPVIIAGGEPGPFSGDFGPYGPGPQILVSSAAPIVPEITYRWQGNVVSQTFPEDKRYPAVLRVTVGGAKDMQVTVRKKDSGWSTTGFTGTKPEYGPGAVEFAPLNPGVHIVTLDGQGASMRVTIKPNSLTYVEFTKVPANSGP